MDLILLFIKIIIYLNLIKMKTIIELSDEDSDKLLLIANADKILYSLFEWTYNQKKRYLSKLELDEISSSYELLDNIFNDFVEDFPNISEN